MTHSANSSFSCPKCGISFTVPQDLTVHVRTKACVFSQSTPKSDLLCSQCPFSSNSRSEFLFHKALHTDPHLVYPNDEAHSSKKRPIHQYRCPVCDKFFAKASLRYHIRVHTSERPYVCTTCNAGFVRKNNWILHTKNHKEKDVLRKKKINVVEGGRPFLCSTCGASFNRK